MLFIRHAVSFLLFITSPKILKLNRRGRQEKDQARKPTSPGVSQEFCEDEHIHTVSMHEHSNTHTLPSGVSSFVPNLAPSLSRLFTSVLITDSISLLLLLCCESSHKGRSLLLICPCVSVCVCVSVHYQLRGSQLFPCYMSVHSVCKSHINYYLVGLRNKSILFSKHDGQLDSRWMRQQWRVIGLPTVQPPTQLQAEISRQSRFFTPFLKH